MDFADLLKTSKRKINQEDGTKIDLKKVRGLSFKLYVSNFYVELQKYISRLLKVCLNFPPNMQQ